ncbi:hypothetical protein BDY17DRAFT_323803 [Neohortaea acidophila]|uniref:Uncharacterized protein n=1 Tax=Neohortaea acidophila TaxID=245834 RepID=A0A6A6PSG1_9PEZI|nr:uncharacterized protein BDY17DRAFT_323803 [Neohortaea acidophila]KAF2483038.1 hypothetical protein BDY17DRAFT_323803 [Neohortaea acidophila]
MPRNLPWQTEAADEKTKEKKVSTSTRASAEHNESSSEDLVDADLNPIRPPARGPPRSKRRAHRTPSTSPPPAPPDVEYMREGFHADDIYMMVEDEFFSTAKIFTQHLHHAEYVRYKRLAASRGAETLENMARPTDGRTQQSDSLKLQIEARGKADKLRQAIRLATKELNGAGSGEEDDYMNDPQLAGLMTGENVSRDLSGVSTLKANTRAAAGLLQSPRNVERTRDVIADRSAIKAAPKFAPANGRVGGLIKEEEESTADEDDLDALQKDARRANVKVESIPSRTKHLGEPPSNNTAPRSNATHASGTVKTQEPSSTFRDTQTFDFLAKRRAEREKKKREEERQAKRAIDVPTFII